MLSLLSEMGSDILLEFSFSGSFCDMSILAMQISYDVRKQSNELGGLPRVILLFVGMTNIPATKEV